MFIFGLHRTCQVLYGKAAPCWLASAHHYVFQRDVAMGFAFAVELHDLSGDLSQDRHGEFDVRGGALLNYFFKIRLDTCDSARYVFVCWNSEVATSQILLSNVHEMLGRPSFKIFDNLFTGLLFVQNSKFEALLAQFVFHSVNGLLSNSYLIIGEICQNRELIKLVFESLGFNDCVHQSMHGIWFWKVQCQVLLFTEHCEPSAVKWHSNILLYLVYGNAI